MSTYPAVRRLVFVLALACTVAPLAAWAQKMILHPPAARAAALAEVMQEQLSLTPEQAASVRDVAEKYAEETDVARGQYSHRKLKQQVKAIAEARDAEFKGILTAEQFAAYQESKRELLKAMKARMKGTTPAAQEPAVSAIDPGREQRHRS